MPSVKASPGESESGGRIVGRSTEAEIQELARIAAEGDLAEVHAYVESMLERGDSLASVASSLLTPAAHKLADEWSLGDRSDDEVLRGLDHIHRVARGMVERG